MKEFDIDSKYIEIELTEASDFEDKVAMQQFVDGLRQHGITVSIDDFGTGYSIFNAIKDLNVAGVAQKGPFVKGSAVTVRGIKCKKLEFGGGGV
mgnify:CR=1 FL=1